MRSLVATLVLLVFLPTAVLAETPPECTKAVPLRFDQKVSCLQGVLFPPQWAVQCVKCRDVALPSCQNEMSLLREKCEIDVSALSGRLNALQVFSDKQSELLKDSLRSAPSWYESPYFWGVVGFVAGTGLTIAVIYAVDTR